MSGFVIEVSNQLQIIKDWVVQWEFARSSKVYHSDMYTIIIPIDGDGERYVVDISGITMLDRSKRIGIHYMRRTSIFKTHQQGNQFWSDWNQMLAYHLVGERDDLVSLWGHLALPSQLHTIHGPRLDIQAYGLSEFLVPPRARIVDGVTNVEFFYGTEKKVPVSQEEYRNVLQETCGNDSKESQQWQRLARLYGLQGAYESHDDLCQQIMVKQKALLTECRNDIDPITMDSIDSIAYPLVYKHNGFCTNILDMASDYQLQERNPFTRQELTLADVENYERQLASLLNKE